MAPTRETSPSPGTMSPALESETPTRDLIGWTRQAEFRNTRRLPAVVTRRLLATALGLTTEALVALDATQLRTALDRLRAMAGLTQKLADLASHDDLTGALRRSAGLSALQREIDRSRRAGGTGIVVIFLDVDGLKHVNDTEGHAAGDSLLVDVVAAIRKRVRSYDLVMRYGGDEFVCALVEAALPDAERTLADIRRRYTIKTHGHTVSAGVATVDETDSAESVVAKADTALYAERRRTRA
ncbi:MAG TPA: GGDEF domain-containing protein [Candidatus Saccharimonadales bacterium]|nr:GGDEF domain-containing protein [Candidatus Saccharimonadales bacterium]